MPDRATDCAGKRAFGNRVAAWPKLAPYRCLWVYMTYRGLVMAALRTELLVADMRLLAPDPSGTPRVGRCQ